MTAAGEPQAVRWVKYVIAKSLVFGDKYEEVFNDEITADTVILPYRLFEEIEKEKKRIRALILEQPDQFESNGFMLHASYHILYMLGALALKEGVSLGLSNFADIWNLYDTTISILRRIIERERESLKGHRDRYNHAAFFKTNKPKKHFEEYLSGIWG